ncbi:hypothetical protein [Devosia sp.]|uniref:O-antigen ligase family protein n=1 Tax=Devosia sp. TaxID=1871048 RepID=UPI00293106E2|nr:hypothetical protein [Devosia sp.]
MNATEITTAISTVRSDGSSADANHRERYFVADQPIVKWGAWSFVALVVVYFVSTDGSAIRYLVYLCPALLLVEAVLRKAHFTWGPTLALLSFLGFAAATLLGGAPSSFFARDLVTVVLIIAPFLAKYDVDSRVAPALFVSAAICGIDAFQKGGGQLGDLGISLGQSRAALETTFGLLTPILVLYFYHRKRHSLALVSAILSILMFKRIAILAMAISFAFSVIYSWSKGRSTRSLVTTALAVSVTAICIGSVFINSIYEFIHPYYVELTGEYSSINSFTSGRYEIYNYLWKSQLDYQNLGQWIFGNGLGATADMMNESAVASFAHVSLLHNDWLRILIDYGAIGLVIVLAAILSISRRSPFASGAVLYTAILFATDNVSMYVFYWTLLFILLASSSPREQT